MGCNATRKIDRYKYNEVNGSYYFGTCIIQNISIFYPPSTNGLPYSLNQWDGKLKLGIEIHMDEVSQNF